MKLPADGVISRIAEFKTPVPGYVLSRGLLAWIKNHTAPLLDPDPVRIANSRLESLCRSTDRKAAVRDHVKTLHARNA